MWANHKWVEIQSGRYVCFSVGDHPPVCKGKQRRTSSASTDMILDRQANFVWDMKGGYLNCKGMERDAWLKRVGILLSP
jgi:hypothetical protein